MALVTLTADIEQWCIDPPTIDDEGDTYSAWSIRLGYIVRVPKHSIEGRAEGEFMLPWVLGWITTLLVSGGARPGDDVKVPVLTEFGVIDCMFWLGQPEGRTLPMRWSHGLGWPS